MKRYIRSNSSLTPELQKAVQEYNDRKKRFDTRMAEYDAQFEPWLEAYDAWQEERKTNPKAPMPNRKDFDKYETIHPHPRFDPEYSTDDAEHTLTMKALDSVAGTDNWIKVNRDIWVKVLSRTKNVRKYVYYTCQRFWECALGSESFKVTRYRDDAINVVTPLEILSEDEFCDFVSNKFFDEPDNGSIAAMIQENSNEHLPSYK